MQSSPFSPVTLIINNVVYMLDDIAMLPRIAKAATPTTTREEPASVPLRILFVEDNDYIRELTLCLLEAPDREVVSCASAEAALENFKKQPFDVVITDVSLPNMSGTELAKQLRALSQDTWLIIASGYQMAIGIDGLGERTRVMTKPFEASDVNRVLKEVATARNAN